MPASHKILIVDDDETTADLLNRAATGIFPEANFIHVSRFSQAVDYLSGLKGPGPRLILLDFDLQSEATGFEFLKVVRKHQKGRLVPVIMLSAARDEKLIQEAYLLGANAFTIKPHSYAGWKTYVEQLRTYWFEAVTTPKLYFDEE